MATIRFKSEVLVVLSGDKFLIFDNGKLSEMQIPPAPKDEKGEDASNKKKKSESDNNSETKNCVLAADFSPSGKFFAIGDDDKRLHVYKVGTPWELLSSRSVVRRCTVVAFPHSEDAVVVADRSGDVYRFSLVEPDKEGEIILGHLSMVLDLAFTRDDKYIVTSDRDEKIRVSHYPNAYNIHTFYLHHTEYVSQVLYLDNFNCLVSGSGDGNICTWSIDGDVMECFHGDDPHERSQPEGQGDTDRGQKDADLEPTGVKRMVYDEALNLLVVTFFRLKKIKVFSLQAQNGSVKLQQEVEVSTAEEPWDVLLSNNKIWLLQPNENKPVVLYNCVKHGDGKMKVTEADPGDQGMDIVNTLLSKWSFFQGSVDCQKQYISLQKVRTSENVQKYMERKQQRISGQVVKPGTQDVASPPEKKLKTS